MSVEIEEFDDVPFIDMSYDTTNDLKEIETDIGGIINFGKYLQLLGEWHRSNKTLSDDAVEFRVLVADTIFNYQYCVESKMLFRQFLSATPKFIEATWYIQEYTIAKFTAGGVKLHQIM